LVTFRKNSLPTDDVPLGTSVRVNGLPAGATLKRLLDPGETLTRKMCLPPPSERAPA
jgi:hypothetical protein